MMADSRRREYSCRTPTTCPVDLPPNHAYRPHPLTRRRHLKRIYIILSLTAKALLAWQVFFPVLTVSK
jgi:hypothetical protein